MTIGIKADNLLFNDEIKLMNKYNESCVNSFFNELSMGEVFSCKEKVIMRYISESDLKTRYNKFYLYLSAKCANLIISRNPYFAGFKKPLIAHEILEARFNSIDYSNHFNDSHDKANMVLLKKSPIILNTEARFKTNWEWNNLESLIKRLSIDSNKSIEEISWYLMPRLVTLK